MFIVLLKFSAERDRAQEFMAGHKAWLGRGFDDKVFLLSGSLGSQRGGAIVAHNTTMPALQARVDGDPFVVHGVVTAELLEVTPSQVDARLQAILSEG